jgi:hypothetical protein
MCPHTNHDLLNPTGAMLILDETKASTCKLQFAELTGLDCLYLVRSWNRIGILIPYLFYCIFHDVASDPNRFFLAHPQNTAYRLTFDRRIPLRLEEVNVIGDFELVQTAMNQHTCSGAARFVLRTLLPQSPELSIGYGLHQIPQIRTKFCFSCWRVSAHGYGSMTWPHCRTSGQQYPKWSSRTRKRYYGPCQSELETRLIGRPQELVTICR